MAIRHVGRSGFVIVVGRAIKGLPRCPMSANYTSSDLLCGLLSRITWRLQNNDKKKMENRKIILNFPASGEWSNERIPVCPKKLIRK
jgi:hypothetical protein